MGAPGIDVVAAGNGDALELEHDDTPRDDAAPSSVLERLRRQTAQQQTDHTVELTIGGEFDPPLVVRYGVLPVRELERYGELAGDSSNVELMLDLMVRTCRAILAHDGDRLVELGDEHGPVVYGHRLAVLLGMPIPPDEDDMPARETLLLLFGGNGMALATHAQELMAWLQNPGAPSPGEG